MIFRNDWAGRPLVGFNHQKREKAVITTTTIRNPSPTSINKDETRQLISSDKVDGTTVFANNGQKLGTVRKLMIDKQSGEVCNVVVGYGGLFGMGEDYYPMPWKALRYDTDKDGYVIQVDKSKLDPDKAPRFPRAKEPHWDATYQREISTYYYPPA